MNEAVTTKVRRNGLIAILLCGAFSFIWGMLLTRTVPGGILDLQGVYYGTKCLMNHCDPYKVPELEAFYRSQGVDDPTETLQRHQVKVLYVNLPTTFLFLAPLALLPWNAASVIWVTLIAGLYMAASVLIWDIGADFSPGISAMLICILLANSEVIFATGNTAGLVIGMTVIAAWCFLRGELVFLGIVFFAAALAMKPHDAGLVWLFFVFAGPTYRRWALRSVAITAVLAVVAYFWVSHAAPGWLPEMRTNLSSISGHGGLNEPGPGSVTGATAGMVVDLQAALSLFWNNASFYNAASYLICIPMLTAWAVKTMRTRFSLAIAWAALAAIVPLTMLVTYHRPYDTKLLLLAVPACAALWAKGGRVGRIAVAITTACVTMTGDVPLAAFVVISKSTAGMADGFLKKLAMVVLTRPASILLLVAAVFYLWVYLRDRLIESTESGSSSQGALSETGAAVG